MRRLLRGSFLLLLAFALVYGLHFLVLFKVQVGGAALIHRTGPLYKFKGGDTWQRFQDHDPATRYDVVVVGSSHAYRGYDPRHFELRGHTLFNLGSTAQTPVNSWPVVKALINERNTGLLIVDVYKGVLDSDGRESATKLIPNVEDDLLAAVLAWRMLDPRAINLMVLRMAKKHRQPFPAGKGYIRSGYCSVVDSVKGPIQYHMAKRIELDERQLEHLDHILDHALNKGIPVILVTHPMPLAADTSGHRRFAELLRAHLGPDGPPYLDLAVDHDLDPRDHFYDHNHLNQAGVDRFNAVLIDTLEALGYLEPRGPLLQAPKSDP